MGRIVVSEWVSLDGFNSGPNNDMGFVAEKFDAEMAAYEAGFANNAEALLLGRVTYESFAGAWPARETDPLVSQEERVTAHKYNSMPKYAVSFSMATADWNNTTIISDLSAETIATIKNNHEGDIAIYGSASVIRELTQAGLIDEYQLLLYPVILGGGNRIIGECFHKNLTLKTSRQFASGVMLLTYTA